MNVISLFILFAILMIISMPIAMILSILALLPNLIDPWFAADPQYVIRAMINGVDSFPLLAVPMFVLSGNIMSKGQISKKLFNFFSYFIADKTAGLPIASIITCLFYGAISGSAPATVAAVGTMTIPIMVNLGYDKTFSTALIAVSGGLGVIIPPSIPFIFYGQASGISVSKLFIAGIIPGILIAFCLILYSYYYCKKNGENKSKLINYSKELKSLGFFKVFKDSFLAILCPIIILGSIYKGIASPTEAAVISVFYALIISIFIYKSLKIKDLYQIFVDSVKTYTGILFIIAAATGFARILTFMKVPQMIVSGINMAVDSKFTLLILINIVLLIVGMFMDTTPAILILTPILVPLIKQYGIDPIHFGLIMVVNLAIGFVTPPLGVNLYVASSLSKIKIEDIVKKVIPFAIVFIIALILITFIPQISLILL